ncbi:glycosyltransferase family 2 protein [Methylosinus sporium]|uniref:glycosyltransferase family 2 protein n=1 Tax=Methylosinus sporium TaxID=428 RepID=UPI00383B6B40
MKFSVVTISYNQAQFLGRAISSVLGQTGVEIDYVVVDPGSTDGSREIIELNRDRIAHIIYEKDAGPADGLNKGFALATGEIYCYLNSDDEFEPGAFQTIADYFISHPDVDVVCGHCWLIDEEGRRLRRVWSDPFRRKIVAYGGAIQIQPSTYIRARAFRGINGFNTRNRISWDGELLLDLALNGARIEVIDKFISLYRVHPLSITGAALHQDRQTEWTTVRFERLMGRRWRFYDNLIAKFVFVVRQIRNPSAFFERLLHGKVSGRAAV